MKDIAARYEFRIWAQALEDPHSQLERLALPSGTQTSEETYLISSATDSCNTKIRDELLEVKLLIASDCGLEQWKPSLKAGFPIGVIHHRCANLSRIRTGSAALTRHLPGPHG